MTHSLTIYGFGSTFCDAMAANDVDLLIVHCGAGPASCQLAIDCKRQLAKTVARAHITMLSDDEEAFFHFIKTANAIRIGTIRANQFYGDLEIVCKDLALMVAGEDSENAV